MRITSATSGDSGRMSAFITIIMGGECSAGRCRCLGEATRALRVSLGSWLPVRGYPFTVTGSRLPVHGCQGPRTEDREPGTVNPRLLLPSPCSERLEPLLDPDAGAYVVNVLLVAPEAVAVLQNADRREGKRGTLWVGV